MSLELSYIIDNERIKLPPAPPRDYVIGGLPVGHLGLLIGSDGSGKSMLALQLAAAVASGIDVAEGAIPAPPRRGPVLYLANEDDGDRFDERTRAIDSTAPGKIVAGEGVRWVTIPPDRPLRLMGAENGQVVPDLERIKAIKNAAQGCRLIILDPLVMYHGLNENDNYHMGALAGMLIGIARSVGCAIIAVHHTSQEGLLSARDDHQAGRGATALASAARMVWVLRRANRDEKKELEKQGRAWEPVRYLRGSKTTFGQEKPLEELVMGDQGILQQYNPPLTGQAIKNAAMQYKRASQNGWKTGPMVVGELK